MASRCTEQAVREFLMERGGRVQQMELIDHFLSAVGGKDQSKEGVDREQLERVVDNVGLVKVENGVKFVCLNAERSAESLVRADHAHGCDQAECHHGDSYPRWEGGGEAEGQEEARVGTDHRDARSGPRSPWILLQPAGERVSILSSATDEDCASVTLDPLEHEWMLCASEGLWESLQPLLAVEPSLVTKRDFVTGLTCLHWAAKQGNAELLSQLLAFAKDNAVPVNVNVRSSAGYTPLHLAAMHGHTQVVRVLLSDWEADPEARDYSGRRAIQYLPPPLAANLQEEGSGGKGRGWRFPRVLPGNLNPLRLLNPTAEAAEEATGTGKTKGGVQRKSSLSRLNARLHRGRHRAQIIHSASFRDTGEMGRGEELPISPLRTRPLSNLFG
uniref:Sosondowah ankyrin repeat domain family member C n=1 Tax=Scophthalmus maximus TaxID=52904 RepID=A0A8D3BQK8_SCOMX